MYILDRITSDTLGDEVREAKARLEKSLGVLAHQPTVESDLVPPTPTRTDGTQITLRLGGIPFQQLNALAFIDRNTMADQIREALALYMEDERIQQAVNFGQSMQDKVDARPGTTRLPWPHRRKQTPCIRPTWNQRENGQSAPPRRRRANRIHEAAALTLSHPADREPLSLPGKRRAYDTSPQCTGPARPPTWQGWVSPPGS